jgi:ubiquinone/menaquinone biosynthesis C-methylase UbiE
MDARLQRRVQRYGWDRAAAHYERCWARQLEPAQDLLLELADLRPGERVLDVACGTGLVTFRAAEAVGSEGGVVAADISDAMVTHVREEAERRGLPRVAVHRTDAETLPWEEGSFDAVLCCLGYMYVPDPRAALAAAVRVLRPGGRLVAAVWGARSACGWAEIFPIVDARVSSEVCPLFFRLGTGGALELEMEESGLRELRAERFSAVLEYASEEDALGAAFLGGPVALAYARFDDGVREEVHREYLASIEAHRRGDGYRIPGEFLVVGGRKPNDEPERGAIE